ncbi:hypothetical protein ACJX0J_037384, partial [Zea mays]
YVSYFMFIDIPVKCTLHGAYMIITTKPNIIFKTLIFSTSGLAFGVYSGAQEITTCWHPIDHANEDFVQHHHIITPIYVYAVCVYFVHNTGWNLLLMNIF